MPRTSIRFAPSAPSDSVRTLARSVPLTVLALTLSCCVAPQREQAPEAAPVARRTAAAPAPAPQPSPLAEATGAWTERPATPGEWIYRRDARGSLALFGAAGQDALLTLRCELPARRIYLTRAGAATGPAPFTIRTTSGLGSFTAQPTGGTPPYIGVALAPTDIILDRMIYSRGRFLVEGGGAPLIVPSWPEIARVTEDCRG